MRFLMTTVIFLLLSSASVLTAEEPPSQTYEDLGFKTIKVLEYKKALREQGEEIPRFPLRSGNALIAELLITDKSRAMDAGLEDQDLITMINGKLLRSPDEGDKLLQKITYKDELELRVIRLVDNRWKRKTITMKPASDLEYNSSQLFAQHGYDSDCKRGFIKRHINSSSGKYNQNAFLLYIKDTVDEPDQLYLRISQFLPKKALSQKGGKPAGFIVKTDQDSYRLAFTDRGSDHLAKNRNEMLETVIQIQSTKEKIAVLEKKEGAENEVIEAENKLKQLVKKYETDQHKQADFKKNMKLDEALREDRIRKQYSQMYVDAGETFRPLLDDLRTKLRDGGTFSEKKLDMLEANRLGGADLDQARKQQGWKLHDEFISTEEFKMIEDMISSETVVVYYEIAPEKKFSVTEEQLQAMKVVFAVFKADMEDVGE